MSIVDDDVVEYANTNHVAIANSIPLVDADPAIIKFQFIIPPKNAANPVKAPKIRPKAMASSPKIITLESQVCASEVDEKFNEPSIPVESDHRLRRHFEASLPVL